MSCRKLIESPETCVDDMLIGLCTAFPQLQLLSEARSVVVPSEPSDNVAVISGGGAGHEPFATGYVGKGMLTGAVSGSVFASPPSTHIHHTVRHVSQTNKGGVVLIVPNYTGDVLNFGLAAEWSRKDGIKLETVVVNEDCAHEERGKAGSRGMCGHLFVYKITGQLALEGKSLEVVAETGRRVGKCMATLGLSTSPCTLPGAVKPLFSIQEGLVELGLGVHGEAGIRSIPFGKVSTLVGEVLTPIISTLSLKSGQQVAVLINNLGATTKLEQWVITGAVQKHLEKKGIHVERIYADHIMTSLDMSGFQICILRLDDSDWLRCLDAETAALSWPGRAYSVPNTKAPRTAVKNSLVGTDPTEFSDVGPELSDESSDRLKKALRAALQTLIDEQEYLNVLDSGCGDGDCGSTLARLSSGVLSSLPALRFKRPATLLCQLAALASTLMGGTSGAVYGLLFSGAGAELAKVNLKQGQDIVEPLARAWRKGLTAITTYSTARRGDRTMLDALIPACEEFETAIRKRSNALGALSLAANSAREGCAATRAMEAGAGRASYVHSDHLNNVDAGAYGVSLWLSAFSATLSEHRL